MTSEIGGQEPFDEPDHIERIRAAIADGSYGIDPVLVADAVLSAWRMEDVIERWRSAHSTGSGGGADDSMS